MRKGYIALEGGEGAGKSRQRTLLAQRYPEMVLHREPGGTKLGAMIREELYNRNRMWSAADQRVLFTADRIIGNAQVIRPALETGHSVLSDRSVFSTIPYQCRDREGRLNVELVMEYWDLVRDCSITIPDVVFIFNISAEEGLRRRTLAGDMNVFDELRLEEHRSINAAFLKLPKMFSDSTRFVVIDASLSEEEIFRQITAEIDAFLASA